MKLKTKVIIAGSVFVGVACVAGVVTVVRRVRSRAKRVLNKGMRSLTMDILRMRAEDFVPGGEEGASAFRQLIERLDDRQLVSLAALVQVGYFIKVSGIDPLHPSKDEVVRAVRKFFVEERAALASRNELLQALDSTDVPDALSAAFNVLDKE